MRGRFVFLIAAMWFVSISHAQSFDVASVKASHSDSEKGSIQMATGSLTIMNAPLRRIVDAGFGIGEDRDAYLLAGPAWIGAERYDVTAKFPDATSADQARPAAEGSAPGFNRRLGHLETRSATMAALADKLSQQSDRPVVDKTAVLGSYEFTLAWTPDDLQSDGQAGPSLFTAIEDQVGLKLEARKEPMEVVVVDYVEKIPSAN